MTKEKTTEPEIEFKAKLKNVDSCKTCCNGQKNYSNHGTSGALYFVGFIGSMVYWMQAAVGFGAVVTGFLKSMVWPAYIVYKLLENFYGVIK